ncbi:MAG: diphthine--ammonia ligase [Nitrospirae bacterium]|nr:diphthine--ammonia ligase [Nitrospirota bacterium]
MYLSSWSGGKDSCLACYKAMLEGYKVEYLVNFISKEYKRCCFHGLTSDLVNAQANSIGIKLFQKEVSPDMKKYEDEFKSAVNELKKYGIKGMVFGDIYLDEHKDWVERVCKELEIEPVEPLWHIDAEKIVEEFIDSGFKAIVVSAKADLFGSDFVGIEVDRKFLELLKARNICPCGENGEFHTFVYDGPIFKRQIQITKSEKVLKEGFWKYWFLDIKEYEVI